MAADHGDAELGHEVLGAEVPTVWPKARGGAEGLEPPHRQVWEYKAASNNTRRYCIECYEKLWM
ncbi:MAG: hypothetical protein ACE5OW_01385 [Candidatus Bathyarchaeia archaeon]